MSRIDVYMGGYLVINEVNHIQSQHLASNNSMIGMPVTLVPTSDSSSFEVLNEANESLGYVHPQNRLALKNALENGWVCHFTLSLVYYTHDAKSFRGEIAYQCYNINPNKPNDMRAFDTYAQLTRKRIAQGERPALHLTGETFDQIVETNGSYTSDETEPLPHFNAGDVVFKKRRSLSDKLVLSLATSSRGVRIAINLLAIILMIMLIVALVRKFIL